MTTAKLDPEVCRRIAAHLTDRVSLSYHAGWLHVSVASPDATGADGVGRFCAEIGASAPELAECDGYTWLRSTSKRKPDVSVSITGDWRVKP